VGIIYNGIRMTTLEILDIYISFFEKREHKRIENSSLVPQNDPTTLFTSSGMQPIIKYLLGEPHPQGKKLVNVQNCFRAQDIDEIGDNRHTTFFRMLGNWSLGDYFKNEEIPWFWELLTVDLKLDPKRLYVSVFGGYKDIEKDEESATIWKYLFNKAGINPEGRIFYCGVEDNWWSRSGTPDHMPVGEPGGPDTEVYFDFRPNDGEITDLSEDSKSGRLLEIGNSVFMTYQKQTDGSFKELPQKNVDFGGGLERQLAAVEDQSDIFQTSLFKPLIQTIEKVSGKSYESEKEKMRIVADHMRSAVYIASDKVIPSNKEAGYILRRLIRRAVDNLENHDATPIIESVVENCKDTDPKLVENFENIKEVILEEITKYQTALSEAKKFIHKKYQGKVQGDELMGETIEITSEDAFHLYTSHGLSPTQIKSLGYTFNEREFANKLKEHQELSRKGAKKKFAV